MKCDEGDSDNGELRVNSCHQVSQHRDVLGDEECRGLVVRQEDLAGQVMEDMEDMARRSSYLVEEDIMARLDTEDMEDRKPSLGLRLVRGRMRQILSSKVLILLACLALPGQVSGLSNGQLSWMEGG